MPLFLTIIEVLGGIALAYLLVTVYLVYRGSNYLRTPQTDIDKALASLHPGDFLIDLGFGNGYVLKTALQMGAGRVTGYEIDFVRYAYTFLSLLPWIIRGKCRLYYLPIWNAKVDQADIVYTFFTSYHLDELYAKLQREMKPGSIFVSYIHQVTGVKPTKQQGQLYFYKM